ncbi:hypothetical protein ACWEOA_28830 [Streptomyces sp. NPDC004457]
MYVRAALRPPVTGYAGLIRVESKVPVTVLSLHSSPSATAKTFRARTLHSRFWSRWAWVQNRLSA